MNCDHYSPEFVSARMREREAGREPACPWCLLTEAADALMSVRELIGVENDDLIDRIEAAHAISTASREIDAHG